MDLRSRKWKLYQNEKWFLRKGLIYRKKSPPQLQPREKSLLVPFVSQYQDQPNFISVEMSSMVPTVLAKLCLRIGESFGREVSNHLEGLKLKPCSNSKGVDVEFYWERGDSTTIWVSDLVSLSLIELRASRTHQLVKALKDKLSETYWKERTTLEIDPSKYLVGFRSWNLGGWDELRLTSPYRNYEWSFGWNVSDLSSSSGFWHHYDDSSPPVGEVFGVTLNGGKIALHSSGFRSSYSKPIALLVSEDLENSRAFSSFTLGTNQMPWVWKLLKSAIPIPIFEDKANLLVYLEEFDCQFGGLDERNSTGQKNS